MLGRYICYYYHYYYEETDMTSKDAKMKVEYCVMIDGKVKARFSIFRDAIDMCKKESYRSEEEGTFTVVKKVTKSGTVYDAREMGGTFYDLPMEG